MNNAVEILKVLAQLAWPLVTLSFLYYFRKELQAVFASIPQLFERMTSAKLPGGFELNLRELSERTLVAAVDVRSLPDAPPSDPPQSTRSEVIQIAATADEVPHTKPALPPIRKILDPAIPVQKALAKGSLYAINEAKAVLAQQIKQIMATSGLLKEYVGVVQGIDLLAARNLFPASLTEALRTFLSIANDPQYTSFDSELIRPVALEAVQLVRLVGEVPRNFHQVVFTDVTLFTDPDGTMVDPSARGVMLRGIDQFNRSSGMIQIFPTNQTMMVGSYVSWEWNMDKTWSERWFLDPQSGEIKTAWTGSAEFVGRDLNEL